jgi:hypothetical protein
MNSAYQSKQTLLHRIEKLETKLGLSQESSEDSGLIESAVLEAMRRALTTLVSHSEDVIPQTGEKILQSTQNTQ